MKELYYLDIGAHSYRSNLLLCSCKKGKYIFTFNPNPTYDLSWGDQGNLHDFQAAYRGQHFLGILDTHNKEVYLVPSDTETPDQYAQFLKQEKEHYISKPKPPLPLEG